MIRLARWFFRPLSPCCRSYCCSDRLPSCASAFTLLLCSGLVLALVIAVAVYRMPPGAAAASAIFGAAYGLFPIGWIILNLIFLYQLTVKKGTFAILRGSLASLAPDPRIQVILIAFCFGAFFEGAAGFGTPVAITSAILIQLGFRPLLASGLSLIANTAPVAFGALGTPILALSGVTGIDVLKLSAMVGRQLPFFSFLIPFWVVWAMAGFRGMWAVWPAALTAGAAFAVPQFLISNFHGPWLVDIVAAASSIIATLALLKFWQPKKIWALDGGAANVASQPVYSRKELARAWAPWVLLTVFVFIWGIPKVRDCLNGRAKAEWAVPLLHNRIARGPEVVAAGTGPEKAIYKFEWLSATGSGILLAALCASLLLGYKWQEVLQMYLRSHRARALLARHHWRDARAGLCDPILRGRRDVGPGAGPHRGALSFFRHAFGMAGRGADRIGYGIQRVVRQFANHHRPAGRGQSGVDGGGQQLGRRNGKNA